MNVDESYRAFCPNIATHMGQKTDFSRIMVTSAILMIINDFYCIYIREHSMLS